MFVQSLVIGYLACLVGSGLTATEHKVAFKCSSEIGTICVIREMKFEDPQHGLLLQDAADKTDLRIRTGSIAALRESHCESLRRFVRINIGPTALGELCVITSFREVSAENNNIQTLHTTNAVDGTDFSLEVLKLNYNKLDSVESMRNFVALKELHLEHNALKTLDMADFARMKQLEKLYLNNNRLSKITDGMIELPRLNYFGLENNTLTALNMQQWDMESLGKLGLAFNNLTNVVGFEKLTALDTVTLAGNQWECLALDGMLKALEDTATVDDADRGCDGIRNTSICCTVEANPSERELLDEMKKFSQLEQKYEKATADLDERIKTQTLHFETVLNEVKERIEANEKERSAVKNPPIGCENEKPPGENELAIPPPTIDGSEDGAETTTETTVLPKFPEGNPKMTKEQKKLCALSDEDCVCPKTMLETVQEELKKMLAKLETSERKVNDALANQPHLHWVAMLNRHEFRTAVKRGEHKVAEVNTKLAMLRDYIDNKLNSLV